MTMVFWWRVKCRPTSSSTKIWCIYIDMIDSQWETIIIMLNAYSAKLNSFTRLKLCLATAIHNFKWVKTTHINNYLMEQTKVVTLIKRGGWKQMSSPAAYKIRYTIRCITTFNRQVIQFEFSPTWSCVSLTRSTTSSEWKLFRFDKMEVNSFQILLIDVTLYL